MKPWVMRVWFAYFGLAIAVAIGLALGVIERNHRIDAQQKSIDRIEMVAKQAEHKAHVAVVQSTFKSEQVCSKSNQGAACRELFNRLENNLSDVQSQRLSCEILANLHGDLASEIRRASHCPKVKR